MDDQFLYGAWRRPRPELVARIRARLDLQQLQPPAMHRPRPILRAAGYATAALLAASAFALPSVRAGAAAFLDLFRIVNFAPIPIQSERVRELASRNDLDLPRLLGEQIQVVKAPGEPRAMADAGAAGAFAGIRLRMPLWLPQGMQPAGFEVLNEGETRVTLDAARLQTLLDVLGINDVRVPTGANGQAATLHVPRIARTLFRDSRRTVVLWQARQPLAELPAGVDIPALAQVGLRILGVESNEAYSFAHSIDWRTTLLVPVPADVAAFRQVLVQGNAGLLIESRRQPGSGAGPRPTAQIMWSAGGSMYVLTGNVRSEELFEMAQSLQ
jgi:hypothetical protein